MKNRFFLFVPILAIFSAAAYGQALPKYSYAAQKAIIPAEIGAVYLGMPFKDFAAKFDLTKAEADGQFEWVDVEFPFSKGDLESIRFKIQGIGESYKEKCLRPETVKKKAENGEGEYDKMISRILVDKVPPKAFVYEIDVTYKAGFDLSGYAQKKFGQPDSVYKKGDQFHFSDMEWVKKTSDGLITLIRYHKVTQTLQLSGHIKGTEWELD